MSSDASRDNGASPADKAARGNTASPAGRAARENTTPPAGRGLRVHNLRRAFGRKEAVAGLSFEAAHGEIMGLLGPNGAGKSTTFHCLAGLLRPDEGEIYLDGRRLGPERGRTIALIPEAPEVYPMLTVWEHLVFVAKSCRLAEGWREQAEALLDRLALADQRDTLGDALSKGMKQKTLIAATVLAGAPVLLLDEPMIGLDPRAQRELRAIMQEIKAGGTVILMSTHMLEQAAGLCDRLLIVQAGREVATGSVEELRRRAQGGGSLEDAFLELTGGAPPVAPPGGDER